ncbi:signaling threshold-regulating transmembrane adapter 1 isoform X1 [Phascolarctos cinereus]|uniref:Signaling threshold-regulating transmembrane adapter 1 isoform X1 n=1 Tax=Phascolarctos cinereus TaxID=38626 RepID=A0A6P5JP01_PHACI|nr:signaling threshold-regulating transmembrane adapter 1 isoform X1 [Phascolarctos cinereus]
MYTKECLNVTAGFPGLHCAFGLWALLGVVTLLLLLALAEHLARWTREKNKAFQEQESPKRPMEEVPLYGNLTYLQTGRLPQKPGPILQEQSAGDIPRVREEAMCYASLQLQPPQGRPPGPSAGPPIKYSEVVLMLEPEQSAPTPRLPEPELYASVGSQTRRAAFPNEDYANSQPGDG